MALRNGVLIALTPKACAASLDGGLRKLIGRAGSIQEDAVTSGFIMSATLATRGATAFSSSSHLPPIEPNKIGNPVTLPSGRAMLPANAEAPLSPARSPTATIGYRHRLTLHCLRSRPACSEDHFGSEFDQLRRVRTACGWHHRRQNEGRCAGCDLRSSPTSQARPEKRRHRPATPGRLPHRPSARRCGASLAVAPAPRMAN